MKSIKRKIKQAGKICGVCEAKFEIWVDSLKITDKRKEKISQKLLNYCPACSIADEK